MFDVFGDDLPIAKKYVGELMEGMRNISWAQLHARHDASRPPIHHANPLPRKLSQREALNRLGLNHVRSQDDDLMAAAT